MSAPAFKILYFSTASTFTGKSSEDLPAPLRLSQLFDTLNQRYPGMKEKVLGSCMVTVDLEYVDLEEGGGRTLVGGEEVAIVPP
ncbi:hypothetical protein RUND412_010050, partial [Rhizina undulata]